MTLLPNVPPARAIARTFVAALRGAIIGAFVLAAGLALVLGMSEFWAQMPVPLPNEPSLALALPIAILVLLLAVTLISTSAEFRNDRERLLGSWMDRLPYSLFALISMIVALSVAGFLHPELKSSLYVTLDGVKNGELWRLLTGAAVHMDTGHLAGNLFGTAALIPSLVVLNLGGRRFWFAALLAFAASDVGSLIFYPDGTQGFSGVLAGLAGVLCVVTVRRIRREQDHLLWAVYVSAAGPAILTVVGMVVWAFQNGMYHGVVPAHAVHIAGIVAGIVVGALLPLSAKMRTDHQPRPAATASVPVSLLEQAPA